MWGRSSKSSEKELEASKLAKIILDFADKVKPVSPQISGFARTLFQKFQSQHDYLRLLNTFHSANLDYGGKVGFDYLLNRGEHPVFVVGPYGPNALSYFILDPSGLVQEIHKLKVKEIEMIKDERDKYWDSMTLDELVTFCNRARYALEATVGGNRHEAINRKLQSLLTEVSKLRLDSD